MAKKYGGVDNKKTIEEIEEATIYEAPKIQLSKTQIVAILSLKALKLIPTVVLIGAVLWVISLFI